LRVDFSFPYLLGFISVHHLCVDLVDPGREGKVMEKEQTAGESTTNLYGVDSDNPMEWAKAFLAAAARDPGHISGEWAEANVAQWFASAMLRTIETIWKRQEERERKSPLMAFAIGAWEMFKVAYVLLTLVGVALLWGAWKAGISCQ
jgi:hypothetical protein